VRPCGFPRGWRQSASRSVSTTDVSRHEHPSKPNLRRLSAERRGKTRRRSPSRSTSDPRFRIAEEDAGPPRGHPTSDSRALDGAPPASGLSTATLVRAFARGGGERCCLVGCAAAPSIEPSDTSLGRHAEGCRSIPCLPRETGPSGARQCHRAFRTRGAFHRRRPRERSFESPAERCPRWPAGQPPHAFIDVREHRLDPSAIAFANDRVAAYAPTASASPCFHEHAFGPLEPPRSPGVRSGRLPGSTELPRPTTITETSSWSGAEEHRSSALPAAIARRGDFAPTRATFGRLLSRPSPFPPARRGAGRG
jgi:hypothetical protein